MTSEPRTEAGRTLAAYELHDFDDRPIGVASEIAAIEDEARSLALSEVEAAIRVHRPLLNAGDGTLECACGTFDGSERLSAHLLRAIAALREGTEA